MLNLPSVLWAILLHHRLPLRHGPCLIFVLPVEGTVPGTWRTYKPCLFHCEYNGLELTLQHCCWKLGAQTSNISSSPSCQIGPCILVRCPGDLCAHESLGRIALQTYWQLHFVNIQPAVVVHIEHHLSSAILAEFQASFSGHFAHEFDTCRDKDAWKAQSGIHSCSSPMVWGSDRPS